MFLTLTVYTNVQYTFIIFHPIPRFSSSFQLRASPEPKKPLRGASHHTMTVPNVGSGLLPCCILLNEVLAERGTKPRTEVGLIPFLAGLYSIHNL